MLVSPIEPIIEYCDTLKIKPTKDVYYITISEQKLQHFHQHQLKKEYPVSTSIAPPSCLENSLGTPLGLHCVAEKIGDYAPPGAVFKGRVETGKLFSEYSDQEQQANLITSRILWLSGLEPGKNQGPLCDSYNRLIYIHGTNHEERISKPQSSGCIELKNQDILTLYDETPVSTLVWIE